MIIPLIVLACMLAAGVLATQPDSIGYIIMSGSAGFMLLSAMLFQRSYRRTQSKANKATKSARLPLLIVIWIALMGIAIPENLTFGSRTTGSDYLLVVLVIVMILTALKQGTALIPPRARPWMFLGLWIDALALIHGTARVGTMQLSIVLSSLMGILVGYMTVCIVYQAVSDGVSAQSVVLTFVVCASIWNFIALAQELFSGSGERLGYATLLNPNAYGAFVAVALIGQLAYLLFQCKHLLLSFINTIGLTLGLVLSGSKAAWGGVLIALLGFLVFGNNRVRAVLLVIIALLLSVSLTLFPFVESQSWVGELSGHLNSTDKSVDSRLITDSFGIKLWTASPLTILLGTGVGVYVQLYAFFTYLAASSIHNTYLRFLVEQGPLGLGVWLATFVVALSAMWQQRHALPLEQRWVLSAVSFALVAVLTQGFVHDIVNQRFFWLFVGLAFALGDKPRVLQPASWSAEARLQH